MSMINHVIDELGFMTPDEIEIVHKFIHDIEGQKGKIYLSIDRPEIEIRQRLNELEEDGNGSVYEHGVKQALRFVLLDLTWNEVII